MAAMVEGDPQKVPYEPAERRFEISEDQFSRERLEAVKAAYKELTAALPGVSVAFSLFGSLSKGKVLTEETKDKADVDLTAFIDEKELLAAHDELMKTNPEYAAFEREHPGDGGRLYAMSILKRHVAPNTPEGDIDDPHVGYINYEGHHSIMLLVGAYADRLAIGMRGAGGGAALESYAVRIARYFHLDVGGGMRKYREAFIQQLLTMEPGEGERYWSIVNRCARYIERGGKISEVAERQFPKTLAEAEEYYLHPHKETAG